MDREQHSKAVPCLSFTHRTPFQEGNTRAIEFDPILAAAYVNWGFIYKAQDKKAEAITDFDKFITLIDDLQLIEMARHEIDELFE